MRQHVNPLSKNFDEIERIPSLKEMFSNPKLPLHLDMGCAAGALVFDLSLANINWNYIGIEIRERLVRKAQLKVQEREIRNLYFVFGNANNICDNLHCKFIVENAKSISLNFPDPWFKKRHNKRRLIQPHFISVLSNLMQKGALIFIKTDVKELFEHMDNTILNNLNFAKVDKKNFNYSQSFNPTGIKSSREKYVIENNLDIFQRIYIKI